MAFKRAERKRAFARVAMIGASGSGKTWSSLLVAFGLGKKVAVIDTEQKSAELYSDLGNYDTQTISPPYEPQKLIKAIEEAEEAGYDVLIIDSLSPFWNGEGGLLEMKTNFERKTKNSFTAWADVTPLYNRIVEAIITSPMHIIATMRSKTEYMVDTTSGSKMKVTKIGTAPVQREGLEYEFTIVFTLDEKHIASVSKDRTGIFDGKFFTPTKKTGLELKEWLESGAEQIPEEVVAQEVVPQNVPVVSPPVEKKPVSSPDPSRPIITPLGGDDW